MKICIVGPGIQPIPPTGWGAVEILIHDLRTSLEKLGHEVFIVNMKNLDLAAALINHVNPDFVHIQYDEHIDIAKKISCKNVGVSSHFGYLENRSKWGGYYYKIFSKIATSNVHVFCSSIGIKNVYLDACVPSERLSVLPNGARTDLFNFDKECRRPKDSIYLAKVEERKKQYLYQDIEDLYFAGRIADEKFRKDNPRHLGEFSKEELLVKLTDFANLVLLSDREAHPLVCTEAMSAGSGVVVSEPAAANLDLEKPFIDLIPNDKLQDIEYVSKVIRKNKEVSISMRKDIRKYAIDNFDWVHVAKNIYLGQLEEIMERNNG